jgi:AraC family transcriptional regulator, regulatory protein of adaptative response / methylated-DNA-[protein]-cysteine methyltransferase
MRKRRIDRAGADAYRRSMLNAPETKSTGPARRSLGAGGSLDHVQRACAFIERHAEDRLTLADLARHVGTSPFHLQRTFRRIVGISPKEYQDALRAHRFRHDLRAGAAVAGALYDAGYGSTSRVYERQPTGGVTPAVYRRGGEGIEIGFTIADSTLGRLLVAGTARGVCAVKLGDGDARLQRDLRDEFPAATITGDSRALRPWVATIVAHLEGREPHLDLPLDVRATAFQWRVWRHLQSIPYGETRAYSEVAEAIGAPTAVRAVARACATNPVCLVVPCHRVVQKDGGLGGYRWGIERKRKLLKREAAGE